MKIITKSARIQKRLKIQKMESEFENRRMVKRKRTKEQTTINKTPRRNLNIE